MQQAIEFHSMTAEHLIVGPRKSHPHSTAILVHTGAVLVRLGKFEIPVCQNQVFWLPSGCLNAVTVLQGSVISTFDLSIRSTISLPARAGFIRDTSLVEAAAKQLRQLADKNTTNWDGAYGRLLRCVRDFIAFSSPDDQYSAELINTMKDLEILEKGGNVANKVAIEKALGMDADFLAEQLRVRAWVRNRKSGQKIDKIAKNAQRPAEEVAHLLEKVAGTI